MISRVVAVAVLLLAGLASQAQQAARVYRIGFVSSSVPHPAHDAFRQVLGWAGYVEGKNLVIETRYAEGRQERLPEYVAEMLQLDVDVLVLGSTPAVLAAKKATATLPIVFASVFDPVASGLVASLARPGGNITGTTIGVGGAGTAAKWVELLKEAAPRGAGDEAARRECVHLCGEHRRTAAPRRLEMAA